MILLLLIFLFSNLIDLETEISLVEENSELNLTKDYISVFELDGIEI